LVRQQKFLNNDYNKQGIWQKKYHMRHELLPDYSAKVISPIINFATLITINLNMNLQQFRLDEFQLSVLHANHINDAMFKARPLFTGLRSQALCCWFESR